MPKFLLTKISSEESKRALNVFLKDFNLLETTIEKKIRNYKSDSYIKRYYYLVYVICSYHGINEYKKITEDMIFDENIISLFTKELAVTFRLLELRYLMGYSETRPQDIIWDNKKNKLLNKKFIGEELKKIIDEYRDVISNHMEKTQVNQKIREINGFIEWMKEKLSLNVIENLYILNRKYWLMYISYICDIDGRVNKTKNAKLLAVSQFLKWIQVIYPSKLNKDFIFSSDDYKKTKDNEKKLNDLAFKNSDDARKILRFLHTEYEPEDVYEELYISAIILAANSGMRRSEISDLEYGNIRFCEDTKLYVINHNVVDKLSVKNRPIYLTEVGYKEILKVMDIKKKKDFLTKRKPRKGGDAYVHLFEFKTSDVLYSAKFDDFMIKINKILNIEKKNDEVEVGLHGYRHFFAMEVFKESGYDISATKYLLRHHKYQMTLHYLAQEREKEIVNVREYLEESNQYEGLGIDSIVRALFFNNKYGDYVFNKKVLNASKSISELIKVGEIKKLSIGYCISPCNNADKCFKCNNFLIEKQEREDLMKYAKELSEIITLKIYLLKQSFSEIEVENKVNSDVKDLMIIIRELEGLGITKDEITDVLNGGSLINE
ncbi:tyrosine-type recombinase/integrase [Clostridium butyricum]|uniref:tyrosine-type recombinase/integrase n=1 Tax=Clostridium butyricum TaxID=1492 RepID=UPI00374F9CF8